MLSWLLYSKMPRRKSDRENWYCARTLGMTALECRSPSPTRARRLNVALTSMTNARDG